MAKKLDWEKRKFDGRPTINIKEESEFRKGDLASRCMAKARSPEGITVRTLLEQHKEKLNHCEVRFLTGLLDFSSYSPKQKKWLQDIADKAKLQEPTKKESARKGKWRSKKPITTPRKSKWQGKKLAPGEPPF